MKSKGRVPEVSLSIRLQLADYDAICDAEAPRLNPAISFHAIMLIMCTFFHRERRKASMRELYLEDVLAMKLAFA